MSDECADGRLKAVRYAQGVRVMEEMIASERKWAEDKAKAVLSKLSGDAMFGYAHCSTGDLNSRAIRLGVLHDILWAMKR